LPRLDILPRMVRSPVEICLGTRPSQAAKSRPLVNVSPVPIENLFYFVTVMELDPR